MDGAIVSLSGRHPEIEREWIIYQTGKRRVIVIASSPRLGAARVTIATSDTHFMACYFRVCRYPCIPRAI